MAQSYEYLFLTLARGRLPHRALAEALEAAAPALTEAGYARLGQFSPQLGWAGNEAAVLLGQAAAAADREAAHALVLKAPGVAAGAGQTLTLAARPASAGSDQPTAGGIYVHRWFTIAATDRDEFVDLSTRAWPAFEGQFETRIFGLFEAERAAADREVDETRLLLITRYSDHGVWEASRDPTSEAMQIFARRQALTKWTRACSTLLVA